jgi:hypothetical protein
MLAMELCALGREVAVLRGLGTPFGDRRAAQLAGQCPEIAERLDRLLNGQERRSA